MMMVDEEIKRALELDERTDMTDEDTRFKQIAKASEEYSSPSLSPQRRVDCGGGFILGAEWADQNPKENYERQIEHLRKCVEVATDACESDKKILIKELGAQRAHIESIMAENVKMTLALKSIANDDTEHEADIVTARNALGLNEGEDGT